MSSALPADLRAVRAEIHESPDALIRVFGRHQMTFRSEGRELVCVEHDSLKLFRGGDGSWRYAWFANGSYGDALDAIKELDGKLTLPDQLAVLQGHAAPVAPAPVIRDRQEKTPYEPLWVTARKAVTRLDGQARQYLAGRGLWPETIDDFKLGLHRYYHKGTVYPAIAIPIYPIGQEEPSAIRLRFIDACPVTRSGKPARYVSVYGSQSKASPLILNHDTSPHTTIFLGGEFKLMRLWQALVEALGVEAYGYQLLSPAGEGIWEPSWRHYVQTRHAIHIPDPDKAGLKYARRVSAQIKRTRVLTLPFKVDDALDAGVDVVAFIRKLGGH